MSEMKMSDYFYLPVSGDGWDSVLDSRGVLFKSPNFDGIAGVAAHAINNHDRLAEENTKLRELLSDVMECVNQDLWNTRCDDAKQILTELEKGNE